MTAEEIDHYLADLPEPKRSTLAAVRETIARELPGAEQCISYAMPAFRVDGVVVAGFAAFSNHLAYVPHSGSVLSKLGDEIDGYEHTKSSLHFAVDRPLDPALIHRLIEVRLAGIPTKKRG
jgi:uncharacterized protein YdhG (YjbR/CyaY superfamily)